MEGGECLHYMYMQCKSWDRMPLSVFLWKMVECYTYANIYVHIHVHASALLAVHVNVHVHDKQAKAKIYSQDSFLFFQKKTCPGWDVHVHVCALLCVLPSSPLTCGGIQLDIPLRLYRHNHYVEQLGGQRRAGVSLNKHVTCITLTAQELVSIQ